MVVADCELCCCKYFRQATVKQRAAAPGRPWMEMISNRHVTPCLATPFTSIQLIPLLFLPLPHLPTSSFKISDPKLSSLPSSLFIRRINSWTWIVCVKWQNSEASGLRLFLAIRRYINYKCVSIQDFTIKPHGVLRFTHNTF